MVKGQIHGSSLCGETSQNTKWTSMLPTMNSRTQKGEFNRCRARPKNDEEFISY